MNKTLVSVIVSCYNQSQYLDEALQSILDQTYFNWECIIVNDGSPDNTEEVAKKWIEKDNRFKYLYQENGGLSSARNYGIKEALGKFILTLDSDDKYASTFIEKGLIILMKDKRIGVVSSWLLRFDKKNKTSLFKPNGGVINDFLFSNSAIGTSLFRKECWEITGGYDEKMKKGYEDWEFYIRICKLGWRVHIIEEPLFFYRQHGVSMRKIAINNYNKEIRKYIFLKHQELYKENYEFLIEYFLDRIEREEKEKIKNTQRFEFKIGKAILKPFRWLKSVLK